MVCVPCIIYILFTRTFQFRISVPNNTVLFASSFLVVVSCISSIDDRAFFKMLRNIGCFTLYDQSIGILNKST
jgi:hypothetical protein